MLLAKKSNLQTAAFTAFSLTEDVLERSEGFCIFYYKNIVGNPRVATCKIVRAFVLSSLSTTDFAIS